MNDDLSPEGWSKRYDTGHTPWDLGKVSPPFVDVVRNRRFTPGRLAVPGCGRGHEAVYFAGHGFSVTAFDFAAPACEALEKAATQAGVSVEVVRADVLSPPKRFANSFDYVLEQTLFCAIDPDQRPNYVTATANLLRSGGTLFGVFFDFQSEDGPPFGTSAAEIHTLFSKDFDVDVLERCETSHLRRRGEELWVELIARARR